MRWITLLIGILSAGEASADNTISPAALAQCARGGVAECQYRYAQYLEHGSVVVKPAELRTWYEMAYNGGFDPAGAAILRLIKSEADTALAVKPMIDQSPTANGTTIETPPVSAALLTTSEPPAEAPLATASASGPVSHCFHPATTEAATESSGMGGMEMACSLVVTVRALSARDGMLLMELEFRNSSQAASPSIAAKIHASQDGAQLSIRDSKTGDALLTGVNVLSSIASALPLGRTMKFFSLDSVKRNVARSAVGKATESTRGRVITSRSSDLLRIGSLPGEVSRSELLTLALNGELSPVEVTIEIGGDVRTFRLDLPA